jgi:flagellar biosynthesis/type III secretory pathway chaperone
MMDIPDAAPTIADFDGLLTNLDRQSALYDQLIALSEEERQAIGRADLTDLARIIAAKEQIIVEARTLESARDLACQQWAKLWGLDRVPTIADVRVRATSPALARRLEIVSVTLSHRVQHLRQINSQNAQLIAQVQRLGDQLITIAMRFGNHPLYDAHGDSMSRDYPGLICDYRA